MVFALEVATAANREAFADTVARDLESAEQQWAALRAARAAHEERVRRDEETLEAMEDELFEQTAMVQEEGVA